jgi:hypothetical protein
MSLWYKVFSGVLTWWLIAVVSLIALFTSRFAGGFLSTVAPAFLF